MWEYLGANVKPDSDLHNTKELRKSCFDMNNQKQRDVYNYLKIHNNIVRMDSLVDIVDELYYNTNDVSTNLAEERMVMELDEKNHPDRELTLEDYISEAKLK